jgi:hypothetical protein
MNSFMIMSLPARKLLIALSQCELEVGFDKQWAGVSTAKHPPGAPAIAIVAALALAVELETKSFGKSE